MSENALEEEARKRRERLKALRKQHDSETAEDQNSPAAKTPKLSDLESPLSQLRFRNYIPKDQDLHSNIVPKIPSADTDSSADKQNTSEGKKSAEESAESVRTSEVPAETEPSVPEDDTFMNLAARKPDWDLKRDIARSLEKLERRTQRAIAEIIRDRLSAEKDSKESSIDLAQAVTWGAKSQEESAFDEWT